MVFGNGVKNIQAAAYNGARTVLTNDTNVLMMPFFFLGKSSKPTKSKEIWHKLHTGNLCKSSLEYVSLNDPVWIVSCPSRI